MPRASASASATYSLREALGDGLVKGDWKSWKGHDFIPNSSPRWSALLLKDKKVLK